MGKRKGLGTDEMHPHNLTMTALGTGLLWFGWFGFNAGSALAANKSAVAAFVNTNTAAAAAVVSWSLIEWLHKGKATVLGACSGAVAGLVIITPAAGFVTPMSAILMGLAVSCACYGAIMMKGVLGYDDSLDVFGVHGVGGACGAIAVGIFAVHGISGDVGGLLDGNPKLLLNQLISLGASTALLYRHRSRCWRAGRRHDRHLRRVMHGEKRTRPRPDPARRAGLHHGCRRAAGHPRERRRCDAVSFLHGFPAGWGTDPRLTPGRDRFLSQSDRSDDRGPVSSRKPGRSAFVVAADAFSCPIWCIPALHFYENWAVLRNEELCGCQIVQAS